MNYWKIVGCIFFMSIGLWAKRPFYSGKDLAARDKQVFRMLTGSQRTPRVWGVTFCVLIVIINPIDMFGSLLYF